MAAVLRAGVIGAGVFGGYHATQLARLPGVELVGVYDHHPAHAVALTSKQSYLQVVVISQRPISSS